MVTPERKLIQSWKWALWLAPVWWALGLNLFIYHLAAGLFFVHMLYSLTKNDHGIHLNLSAYLLFAFVVTYLFSLLTHLQEGPTPRVIASAYNLSYWVMGFFLVVTLSNLFPNAKIRAWVSAFPPLGWPLAVFFFVMLVLSLQGHIEFSIRTPLYSLGERMGNTALVRQSVSMMLLVYDWFNEQTRPRFNALSPYATATAALIMIVLIMTIVKAKLERTTRRPAILFLLVVYFFAMFFTLSRATVIAFGAGFAAVMILRRKEPFLWLLAFLVVLVLSYPLLEQALSWILGLRGGSTSARFDLYRASLEQLQGIDWVFGVGLKPRNEDSLFPLGSHSTYVSLVFRTGIVGMLLIAGFQLNLLWQWFKLKPLVIHDRSRFIFWSGIGWVLISMNFWIWGEDLDAPQLLAYVYFSVVGIFEGFRKEMALRG